MGRIKKIGEHFYVEFEARGLKYQQLAGSDEQQALRLLNEIEAKIKKGETSLIVRDIDTAVFFYDYLESIAQGYSDLTVSRFKSLLSDFISFINSRYPQIVKLSQLTPKVIEDYKVFLSSQFSRRVVNLNLILLQDVFDFALKCEYLNDNPTLHVKLVIPKLVLRPRVFKDSELASLMGECGKPFAVWADGILKDQRPLQINRVVLKNTLARELIFRRLPFIKICEILGFKDISRCVRYAPFLQEFKLSSMH